MKKKIIIITISSEVGRFYKHLLYDLFGDLIEIYSYSVEKNSFNKIQDADLYLVATTSSNIFDYILSLVPEGGNVVVSNITLTKKSIETLMDIPKGTRAMLVNLSINMAIETISDLNRLGVTNIEFFPVYPEIETPPDLDMAITPSESRFVPNGVKTVIDIGHRVFTANTIVETALKLGFSWFLESEKCKNYINSLAEIDYSINTLASKTLNIENKFEILLEAMDVGIIGINADNIVFAFNKSAENITGIVSAQVMGKTVFQYMTFIPEDIISRGIKGIETRLVKLKETYINITVTPILQKGIFVGHFIIIQRFSDEENKQHKLRLQLLGRGHTTKYTFDDIIGECTAIINAKKIAAKMAQTGASILLTGESGTGKELFAHSIHHNSSRCDMPFVAINCAALPDTLLESELFGYGDGAFTGAKKGGKIGLFEHAHKGTLFLDEIEGMSQNLQIKLLRVLQEKEVMRIGENKIINIDVRIIAASNENIRNMVQSGNFRKDLYYRLNTLPIDIPPLRERGNDIFIIMDYIKEQIEADFVLSDKSKNVFLNYKWDGNIRELKNIIEYLKFMDSKLIEFDDLPEVLRENQWDTISEDTQNCCSGKIEELKKISKGRLELYVFVIDTLCKAKENRTLLGRKSISDKAWEQGMFLSEQEVRTILYDLNELGLAVVSRGRGGSRVTALGEKVNSFI